MNIDLLNDTFDNFTLSDIQSSQLSFKNATFEEVISSQNTSSRSINAKKTSQHVEVSFDDSLFLSSLEIPEILDLKNSFNKSERKELSSATEEFFSISQSQKSDKISQDPTIYKLSSWGLPPAILEKYEAKKITTMFPWQVECLNKPRVLQEHRNLVYSAPTSAGKTLVAEILAIKTILERRKKVIFILPFVSVVREKMFYFQDILGRSGIRVEGFMGSYNPPGGFQSVNLAICTIEKANSLINKLLQDQKLSEIGTIIIDEMHLLGDPNRGYILELLLTKLRYISAQPEGADITVQIIGMSATLPNLNSIANWLDAELFITDFRPIPLNERAIIQGDIYDQEMQLLRHVEPYPELGTDTDSILQLCLETIQESCSVLIFCPTKNWCENLAQQVATAFWKLGQGDGELSLALRAQITPEAVMEVLEQLKFCPVGLDLILRKTISFGVAFHHAGLTLDERDIIEGGFRQGAVRVLIATSTLSSGVNLPAKRVIIRTPIFHGKPLDEMTYKQMVGRAGRMGRDTSGESFLVCQPNDQKIAKFLMQTQLEPVESCLNGESRLKRALLEIVASGIASTPKDLELFSQSTLLSQTSTDDSEQEDPINNCLDFLIRNEFIALTDGKYTASSLGKACLVSSIPPEDGLALFTELERARQCFVLETELHLIYLVTPYSACHQWGNLDWMLYLKLWEKLPATMKRVADLIGVQESFIVTATRGRLQSNTTKSYQKLMIHKRFFVSLALQDLVNERPLNEVSEKFSCNRGTLQSLQLTASTFAGMVTAFSRQLGWSAVEILISQFQDRLQFGVARDLLDLMRLPLLNGKSARALFNGGLETLIQLANSDIATIESILQKVAPFERMKLRDGETEFEQKERNKFKNIWITGREGLTEREAAELLLTSSRKYLEIEMGLADAKWDQSRNHSDYLSQESSLSEASSEKSEYHCDSLLSSIPLQKHDSKSDLKATSIRETNGSDDSLFEDSLTELSKFNALKDISKESLNSSGDIIPTSQDSSWFDRTCSSSKKRRRSNIENDFLFSTPMKRKRDSRSLQLSQDFSKIDIVNVCSNEKLLKMFLDEVKAKKCLALSLALGKVAEVKRVIGFNDIKNPLASEQFVSNGIRVEGFAISWGEETAYYLDLSALERCLEALKFISANKEVNIKIFNSKEQVKLLKKCCGIDVVASVEDPKVADWILEPEGKEKNFKMMVINYFPAASTLYLKREESPKIKTCLESLLTWHLTDILKEKLKQRSSQFLEIYKTETSCLQILTKMELTGISVSEARFKDLLDTLNKEKSILEKKAHSLAGHRFSLSSTKQVAKILGINRGSKKVSTRKEILEKCEHPIAQLILQWRKIIATITKTVQPIIRSIKFNRVFGSCIIHTATGRISMHEPNLQNIAKNFDVDGQSISCRSAFKVPDNCMLISADYCQLELRLLAHLSGDKVLCGILRKDGDVFKSVAAKWAHIEEKNVTDEQRQRAKQLCYGIIYGIGSRALSEQLKVDENDAIQFMMTFKNNYPEIKNYIEKVIEKCRKLGYVETYSGRRRYLPRINDPNTATRSQAERQAVNTTIQGSAADISKRAMIKLDELLLGYKAKLVLHLHDELLYEVPIVNYKKFVKVLKNTMETTVTLSIPLPVKVKSGRSWGELTELKL